MSASLPCWRNEAARLVRMRGSSLPAVAESRVRNRGLGPLMSRRKPAAWSSRKSAMAYLHCELLGQRLGVRHQRRQFVVVERVDAAALAAELEGMADQELLVADVQVFRHALA